MQYQANSVSRSVLGKKAPLQRLLKAARPIDARSANENNGPTLNILRSTLLSGLSLNEMETAAGTGRRFRDLLERAAHRIA